jgi:hypothetical protein
MSLLYWLFTVVVVGRHWTMLDFLFGSSERELALLYSIVFTYCFELLLFYYCLNTSVYRNPLCDCPGSPACSIPRTSA